MRRKPGEPPKAPDLLQVRLGPEYFALLDEIRRAEPDMPNRSDMIRRLIDRAPRPKPPRR